MIINNSYEKILILLILKVLKRFWKNEKKDTNKNNNEKDIKY